ncbi:IS110 family transposase [Saliniramus fredricksonii]|jgi:transposase|uniref:Transposase IS116/IS110/IS902 family protein n=1 Tax=Saliniramus fredricksonii TaxID=1653334 RepID=A0ABY0K712_9HYPH|nr:IS110 family transposase [Saliniramus fredricksonii]SCC79496.1 Transposase IS116/IS110/IS902 family protein [Saliniramus fredricksonii]SCC79778.1 Transposase IS116/IS110/IS902 family protein [Saliniramus fredricksonii]SCC80181.1 Transposase IS116/IS110/IS902 family protein [Saliniramus fredricksonii]
MHRTVGIDLAIRGDHVAQIFENGKPVGRPIRFRHDAPSLDAFVASVSADVHTGTAVQAIMEPTGMSWFPVAHRLGDAGVEVARVKGKRVKALRRYLSEHAKTDLADAHVLAAIPSFGGPRLDPVHVPSPKSHALQRLTKQRGRLQDEVAASKRRLMDLVRWASPVLERVLPDLRTRLSLAVLQHWLDPDRVLRARKSTLARFIAEHASGNQPHSGPFVDALVDGIRDAARQARKLHRHHVDFVELQMEVAVEIELVLRKIELLGTLERRIERLYSELQPDDVLRTIPGVGQRLAPVLAGVIHDAGRFRSERHLRGFCGLFPRRADSGGAERPGQKITASGNDRIKRALMLAADTARKIDPKLAETYWRLMTTKGHHHKQALCAVANRLANRIYSVLRDGRPYVLRDVDGLEISVADAKAIIAERYHVPNGLRASRRASRAPRAGA